LGLQPQMNRQGQGQDPLLVHSLIRSRVSLRMAGVELSARTLALQHRVAKSELWKGFSGAPTAAFAAVGYL